jgi:O-antigen ligase
MSVAGIQRHRRRHLRAIYVLMAFLAVLTIAIKAVSEPGMSPIALAMLLLGSVVILAHPPAGVYFIVFFALVGDISTTPWYPFAKGFSSRESVLFVDDRIVVNPLEVFMVLTTAAWLARGIGDATWRFKRGALLTPLLVFASFVVVGLAWGLQRGGDRHVGLWEARPLMYLPLFYVLVTNLLTTVRQYQIVFWTAMVAVTVQSILALDWYQKLEPGIRANLESLTEHSGSVHMNAMFVFVLAGLLLRGFPARGRVALPILAVPVVWAYFVSERRSAVIGFALGVILFAVLLYRLQRRTFWWFVPIFGICSLLYLGAFWTVESKIGFPARAIKSAIAPGSVEGADRSSDEYRRLEALNIWYTIRADPVRGIGFGQVFYQLYPLPDISFFPFWRYMPHNSFLWIWLKTGFAGFVSMLYLMIRAIQHGVRSTLRLPPGTARTMCATATLYVPMYLVFSYVDIAWDIRSMIFMAVVFAVCADMQRLVEPAPVPSPVAETQHDPMSMVTT